MSQSQGKPTDREILDSLGGDPLAQSIKSAPATPLDIESTADTESSVAHVDNVKQLKDPDLSCHDLSTSDTCNSKTLDGDDSSSSSIPSTKNGDLLATGASAGTLSTNLRRETDRPGNQASLVGTKLSTESRGRDEGIQSEHAPLIAAEREKKEPVMKGKAASAAGEVDASDIISPPPQLVAIQSATPPATLALAVQSPPTLMPAPQVQEQKTVKPLSIRHSPSLASISSYPTSAYTMSQAAISQASLSRVQSGHSFLSQNPPQKKVKDKTRPQQVGEPGIKKKFLARLGIKKDVPPRTQEETKTWLRGVSPENAGFLAQILSADTSGSTMKWDDFVSVLRDLGFAEVAKRRSKVRFKPPYQGLPKSTFPKPRSGNTIDPNTLQKCSKKLKDRYGWSEELLPEHANLQSSARAGID